MSADRSSIVAACAEAARGRRLWRAIRKRYSFDWEDLLLLMPAVAGDVEKAAVDYLPSYLRRKRIRQVVAVTADEATARRLDAVAGELPAGVACRVELRPGRDIAALCRYYCFVQFTQKILVISTAEPFAEPGLLQADDFGPRQMVETYLMGW